MVLNSAVLEPCISNSVLIQKYTPDLNEVLLGKCLDEILVHLDGSMVRSSILLEIVKTVVPSGSSIK
jgi:hypothetical protein